MNLSALKSVAVQTSPQSAIIQHHCSTIASRSRPQQQGVPQEVPFATAAKAAMNASCPGCLVVMTWCIRSHMLLHSAIIHATQRMLDKKACWVLTIGYSRLWANMHAMWLHSDANLRSCINALHMHTSHLTASKSHTMPLLLRLQFRPCSLPLLLLCCHKQQKTSTMPAWRAAALQHACFTQTTEKLACKHTHSSTVATSHCSSSVQEVCCCWHSPCA
jgi:hypothetical protein